MQSVDKPGVGKTAVDNAAASLRRLTEFVGARTHAAPLDRLRAVRRGAHALREVLASAPPVALFRSFDVAKVPYPTKYALRDACGLPVPFVHILNRLFVVQFATPSGIKTLLGEPLDRLANARTPFFARLAAGLGGADGSIPRRVWPALGDVEASLRRLGIAPSDVDYITYDHLHTQDLRRWLGSREQPGYFPNAKLLVMRQEWASVKGLLPTQAQWYCPGGTDGIPDERVIQLEGDTWLGDSVALVHTPGHTEGNHSLVVKTGDGVFVSSENGVAAECYAPEHSRIPGVARWAKRTGCEVVLNGNTLEGAVDQYISMVQEKEIAGPSRRDPRFPNVAPSSELSPHPLSFGLRPTFHVGEIAWGAPVTGGAR